MRIFIIIFFFLLFTGLHFLPYKCKFYQLLSNNFLSYYCVLLRTMRAFVALYCIQYTQLAIHQKERERASARTSNGQKVSDALLSLKRILFIILLQANNALALVVQFVFTVFNFPNELDFVRLPFFDLESWIKC